MMPKAEWWTWLWPLVGWAIVCLGVIVGGSAVIAASAVTLFVTVFGAVYHAEVVAHRVGEPFGTLVLAVAVAIIETALIISITLAAPSENTGLARDAVYAAVMIVCNGIVGACLLAGGARHREQAFQVQAASAALAVLVALTGLTLILPNFVSPALGPHYSKSQLIFAAVVSLAFYSSFIFVQTVRHRDYFLPLQTDDEEEHAAPPTTKAAFLSGGLLIVSLGAIVGLAKILTPSVEVAIAELGLPKAVVGIIIAALVLLPEGVAALKAASTNRLQTSLNLALGSALATIGLTIPAVAVVSIVLGQPLSLGLEPKDQVLLAITLILSVITLGTGRTTVLQGIVHLLMFGVFFFLAIAP